MISNCLTYGRAAMGIGLQPGRPVGYHAGPMRRLRPAVRVPLLLLGLTWAVYAPVGRYGFVGYDDPDVIVDNPHVGTGLTWANVRWAATGFAVGHWEPLTWWSLQADASAWHGRAGPMHVENALLHAVGSAVLYGMLAAATGSAGRSAVVAALFAVHPMHVESVAWLTERRDVLSTPPLLAAIWAYARFARAAGRRRWAWYAVMFGLYCVSLSAKATGMTLPAVLLLLDVWPLGRSALARGATAVEADPRQGRGRMAGRLASPRWLGLVAGKAPLAVPAVGVAVLAVAAQRAAGAASSFDTLTLGQRLANAAVTAVVYVAKLAVPVDLAVIYPHPGSRPAAAVVAATALLALVTAVAWRQRRRRPFLLVGWLWFAVTLGPTSGIVQSGPQAMADRYAYVPSIGLFVAAVWAVRPRPRPTALAAAAVVTAAYAAVARVQVGYWADTETLFRRANAVTDRNWVADVALGKVAADRGDWPAAAALYRRAAGVQPNDAKARAGLAGSLLRLGDGGGAERAAAAAVRLTPTVAAAHVLHARTLAALPGRRADAIAECQRALAIDPGDADARAGLADLRSRPPEGRP